MTDLTDSDGAAMDSEMDETPSPIAPSGIWVSKKGGGRRPLIRDWSGDLEIDALRRAPSADLAAIAENGNHPLHEKALLVREENEKRWRENVKGISALAAQSSGLLSKKMFDVSDFLPKYDFGSMLPKIGYGQLLPKFDVAPILSLGLEASLRRAQSEAVGSMDLGSVEGGEEGGGRALGAHVPPESGGGSDVSLADILGPSATEILTEILGATHAQRANLKAQHLESVAELKAQSKSLEKMVEIARSDAEAARADGAKQIKLSQSTHKWTVAAAVVAIFVGVVATTLQIIALNLQSTPVSYEPRESSSSVTPIDPVAPFVPGPFVPGPFAPGPFAPWPVDDSTSSE